MPFVSVANRNDNHHHSNCFYGVYILCIYERVTVIELDGSSYLFGLPDLLSTANKAVVHTILCPVAVVALNQ